MIFLNSLHSLQDMNHSKKQQVWVWKVWWYMIVWFDLPNLTRIELGKYSFSYTKSINLSSTSLISSSSDVPFSNGHFSMSTDSYYYARCTFRCITSSSITSDSTSSLLKNCILNKGSSWCIMFPPHLNSLTMVHSSQKSSIPAIFPSHVSIHNCHRTR